MIPPRFFRSCLRASALNTFSPLALSLLVMAAARLSNAATDTTSIVADNPSVNTGIRSYTCTCSYQHEANKIEVLLPDSYSASKHYRVTYLLPVNVGTTGQWGSGIVEAKKANLQNQHDMIFVAPAYDTQPWFGDNPAPGGERQNDYMLNVVVPFIDKEFSTIAEARGRFLVGFSKSGLGAWALFLMHPDLFDQVALFDSYQGQPSAKQWNEWGFAATYGTRENFDKYDPMALLSDKKEMLQRSSRRITILGGGPGSRVGVDTYRSKLVDFKIPHIYIQGSNMAHNWYSGWLPLAVAGMAYPDYTPPAQ